MIVETRGLTRKFRRHDAVQGGRRHLVQLWAADAGVPAVLVTAYEARVHFNRQIAVPGVLGGSASSCPAP